MTTGHCLCGAVSWRAGGKLTPISHCHCSMCRKAHGAAFASFTSCAEADFEWTGGGDHMREYRSSPGVIRRFCGTCGSALPGTSDRNGQVFMPVAEVEGDPGLRGGRHIFVESKAPWHILADDLEQFDGYPSGPGQHDGLAAVESPARPDPQPGVLQGSCLCGEVAFEIGEPFSVVHNCHCSLCRRARAAAHTTNGFVSLDALTVTRGADSIKTFVVPGRRMGQSFCAKCGSGLPRANPARGFVILPLSSIDDAIDRHADDHIFVGSKAEWYEIADHLPQFDEMPG